MEKIGMSFSETRAVYLVSPPPLLFFRRLDDDYVSRQIKATCGWLPSDLKQEKHCHHFSYIFCLMPTFITIFCAIIMVPSLRWSSWKINLLIDRIYSFEICRKLVFFTKTFRICSHFLLTVFVSSVKKRARRRAKQLGISSKASRSTYIWLFIGAAAMPCFKS